MRYKFIVCFIVLHCKLLFSQSYYNIINSAYSSTPSYSARLEGMGNLSIAVPEPESEAFYNPAKAELTSGILLRFYPNYIHYNNKSEYSYSSTYQNDEKSEYALTSASFPLGALISFDILHIGVSYSREVFSISENYETNSSSPYKYDQNITNNGSTAKLLASVNLGSISIGAIGTISGTNLESKYINYNSSFILNNVYRIGKIEENNFFDLSNKEICVGGLINIGELTQISALIGLSSSKLNMKPSERRYDGVLQPNDNPPLIREENKSNTVGVELRQSINSTFLLGIRGTLNNLKGEFFDKRNYSDFGRPSVYEERKYRENNTTKFGIGLGMSYKATEGILIGVEFELMPIAFKSKSFVTTESGPTSDIHRGNISSESKLKEIIKAFRAGGETHITSMILLRAGIETLWGTSEIEGKSYSAPAAIIKYSGETTASITGRLGFTLNLRIFQIDYGIAIKIDQWYSNSLANLYNDIHFQHFFTVSTKI